MTDRYDNRLNRLERNASGFRHDPILDRAADLFHTDREAWNRLPAPVRSQSAIYADLREHHRAAIEAGAVSSTAA